MRKPNEKKKHVEINKRPVRRIHNEKKEEERNGHNHRTPRYTWAYHELLLAFVLISSYFRFFDHEISASKGKFIYPQS